MQRLLLLAAAGFALALIAGATVTTRSSSAVQEQPGIPGRLDSRFAELSHVFQERGVAAALERADELRLDTVDASVRAIIEFRTGAPRPSDAAALGVRVEGSYGSLVQGLAPLALLDGIAQAPHVAFVRPPLEAAPMATGEGVSLTNADDWHAQGVNGSGVKVAVLDLGFQGYEALLGSELPPSVTARSFRADGDITGGGTAHGTGVAEIVHEMAPGAQMYLVNFDTEVELANASQWLTSEGVQAVNASWGYFVSGPGDGTGLVDGIVSTSTSAGALWSAAAGNHAQRHWSGTFRDANNNGFHEFAPSPSLDEGNQISGSFLGYVFPGEVVYAELKWDDPYGAACQDYNLYIMRTDDSGGVVTVASAENVQNDGVNCVPGADPFESLTFEAAVMDIYHIVVKESVSTRDARLHVYSHAQDIEYQVASGSIGQPADNPVSLAVGAVYWGSPDSIEPFSSRGPTEDGRIKPDAAGPDGVSNTSFGAFFGTSAATPHITGVAALIRQILPCYTPAQVKATIEVNTLDIGSPGKDNSFGSGRVLLPSAPPPDSDGDGIADACETAGTPTPTPAASPTPTPTPCPDSDGDGWTDCQEAFIGTDATNSCTPNGWPPDPAPAPDGDGTDHIEDVTYAAARFGAQTGQARYTPRIEIASQDGLVHIDDVTAFASRFGQTCGG